MKIVKVSYQKAYIIGPYLQEKVGFEAELGEPETMPDGTFRIHSPETALTQLKQIADKWHKKQNPHLYEGPQSPETHPASFYEKPSPMPIIDRSAKEKLEIAIDNADSLETLSTLKEEASKHNLVSLYMERLRNLTNGKGD